MPCVCWSFTTESATGSVTLSFAEAPDNPGCGPKLTDEFQLLRVDLFLRHCVSLEVVAGHGRGDRILSFRGDEQNRALQTRQHGQEQVQENKRVRIPGPARHYIRCRPRGHGQEEGGYEPPASHGVAENISGTSPPG